MIFLNFLLCTAPSLPTPPQAPALPMPALMNEPFYSYEAEAESESVYQQDEETNDQYDLLLGKGMYRRFTRTPVVDHS